MKLVFVLPNPKSQILNMPFNDSTNPKGLKMEPSSISLGQINKEQEKREFISWRKIVVRKFKV